MTKVLHPRLFPFCISQGLITSGSYIKTDLENAMWIYWKVRYTYITVFQYEVNTGNIFQTDIFTFPKRIKNNNNYASEIPNETYLVCGYQEFLPINDFNYNIAEFSLGWNEAKQSNGDIYIPVYFNFIPNANAGRFGSAEIYGNLTTMQIYGHNVAASYEDYRGDYGTNAQQTGVVEWAYSN